MRFTSLLHKNISYEKRKVIRIYIRVICPAALASCSKDKPVTGAASLTLVNGMVGSTPYLVTNFSGGQPLQSYTAAMKISYATYSVFNQSGSYSGLQPLAVYRYPDTTVHSSPVINVISRPEAQYDEYHFPGGNHRRTRITLFTTDLPLSGIRWKTAPWVFVL